jgi:L-amino acid N-acyltransferase YncA
MSMPMYEALRIRLASTADLEAIRDIYNHYVLSSTCTYQNVPDTAAERAAWFAGHDEAHPVTVVYLKEVGHKFGRWLDVVFVQKML